MPICRSNEPVRILSRPRIHLRLLFNLMAVTADPLDQVNIYNATMFTISALPCLALTDETWLSSPLDCLEPVSIEYLLPKPSRSYASRGDGTATQTCRPSTNQNSKEGKSIQRSFGTLEPWSQMSLRHG